MQCGLGCTLYVTIHRLDPMLFTAMGVGTVLAPFVFLTASVSAESAYWTRTLMSNCSPCGPSRWWVDNLYLHPSLSLALLGCYYQGGVLQTTQTHQEFTCFSCIPPPPASGPCPHHYPQSHPLSASYSHTVHLQRNNKQCRLIYCYSLKC